MFMDEFLREVYVAIFAKWMQLQDHGDIEVMQDKVGENNALNFDAAGAKGQVVFHQDNAIIEFSITNKKNQNIEFYLHFQMQTLKHAVGIYYEFMDIMHHVDDHKTVRVLLSCSSGLTTSFFAQELNKGVQTLNLDYEFSAVAYNELADIGMDYDMILLAPQIGYQLARVRSIFHRIPVLTLPSAIFAKYDVGSTIDLIKETLTQGKPEKKEEVLPTLSIDYDKKILAIGILKNYRHTHIHYRVYQNAEVLLNGERIHDQLDLRDLNDIIDYVLLEHPDIHYVGIAAPGIIHYGFMTNETEGFNYTDVAGYLKNKHPELGFSLDNDVNAVAAGLNVLQDDCDSVSFYFLPRGHNRGGAGTIFHDRVIKGYMNIAGEMQYLPLAYSDQPTQLARYEEGAKEVVAKNLVALIATIGPQLLTYYCSNVPSVDELVEEMEKYIPKKYIPPVRKIENLKEFILFGEMIMCINRIRDCKENM